MLTTRVTPHAGLAVVLIGCLLAASAQAGVVLVDQPGSTLPGVSSTVSGGGRGVFDDFMLAADSQLTRVEWTGGLVSASTPSGLATAPDVLFKIGVLADNGGDPGALVGDILASHTLVTGTLLSSSSSQAVYRYGVDLSGLDLTAGVRYWLAINALFSTPPSDPTLTWDWSPGTLGNGQSRYFDTALNDYVDVAGDLSFTLIGNAATPIPVPGTLALVLAAAGGLGLVRGRRRA
jgi:hypothetical protein